MLEQLKKMLVSLNEDIELTELNDLAYTMAYKDLCKKRKAIIKAIIAFEK